MSSTMLELVNQVQNELNLAVSSSVAGNPSTDVQQILALMNASGYELTREYDWQALEKQHIFYTEQRTTTGRTTLGSFLVTDIPDTTGIDANWQIQAYQLPQATYVEEVVDEHTLRVNQKATGDSGTQVQDPFQVLLARVEYPLPPDYMTITNRTQWQKTKHWEMLGPVNAQQWQWLISGYIATGPRVRWRILADKFQIWPASNSEQELGFEYRSQAWALSNTGDPKNSFTADTDKTIFDNRLLVLYTKLKYFQIKAFDTTSLTADYNRYLSVAKANDKGAANLSFAPPPTSVLIGWANIPDSGYGDGSY